jgi:opacity protein-like surface antigen
MSTQKGFYTFLSIFISCSVSAGDMGEAFPSNALVATVSAGPAWERGGETQTFYLVPHIQKTYLALPQTNSVFTGELFLGRQHALSSRLTGQLGVAFADTTSGKLVGNIWEDANPNFNNFNYSTEVNQMRLSIKGKLIADVNKPLLPYITAGLGAGFNHAYHFTITPKLVEEVPAPPFNSNKTTAFTYTWGAGVQRNINQHWQAGVGYEYAHWGNTTLSRAPGQTLGHGLKLNAIHTQTLLFHISYVS